MTPLNHSLYALTLFLALACLLAWSNRRDRTTRRLRNALLTAMLNEPESHEEPAGASIRAREDCSVS
jgi:hypothetical protein